MPELLPVLMFILFQIPVPLSTILMLIICLGTDMWPAISLAYENGELDLMDRMPRSAKRDHLVTGRLICFSYL
jgi:sodium/potassium-transporting ATPase subunit alpha